MTDHPMSAEEAWQEWDAEVNYYDPSERTYAAFMAGYRIGAKAQWDASVADEFAARRAAAADPTDGTPR